MTPIKITLKDLYPLLRPTHTIIVKNGERGILNWMISKTQQHLIKDLNGKLPEANRTSEVEFFSAFTHSMMVFNNDVNEVTVAENFFPHTRVLKLSEKIKPGSIIVVSELKSIDTFEKVISTKYAAATDVLNKTPYSWWKLLYYYGFQWGWQKTFFGKPAMEIFRRGMPGKKDDDYQVCSGSVWKWYMSGIDQTRVNWLSDGDKMPEMWYPARLASDNYYMKTIGIYEII